MEAAGCSSINTPKKRLLKCFCGCKELTEEEVKRIYRFSVQEILINVQASELFRKFLEKERSGDKSEAEQYLDVYQLCEQYMKNKTLLTEDEVEELIDLGLPYDLEKKLRICVRTGDKSNMELCLFRIQGHCRNAIEPSAEYKGFKSAILDKLKGIRT